MNEKLKRLAKNLTELLDLDDNTPQEVYDKFRALSLRQKDYFSNFSPENIIKLVFLIWSYKLTKNFELAEKTMNRMSFAVLFTTEGNTFYEDCDECDGSGNTTCSECDGNGEIECGTCDGEGKEDCEECVDGLITCETCEGSGESEDGDTCSDCHGEGELKCQNCDATGRVECSSCYGDGDVECPECDGDGSIYCQECDGNGQIATDKLICEVFYILTWSDFIKNRCELSEDSDSITMSEYDFDRLRDEYIKLNIEEDQKEFFDFVEENEVYCPYYGDYPKLTLLKNNMEIEFPFEWSKYAIN